MIRPELKLKSGCFGAEPWTEEMRQHLEELLDFDAFDIYGLTEIGGPGVAFECFEKNGMHINEDHVLAEIIDPVTEEPGFRTEFRESLYLQLLLRLVLL